VAPAAGVFRIYRSRDGRRTLTPEQDGVRLVALIDQAHVIALPDYEPDRAMKCVNRRMKRIHRAKLLQMNLPNRDDRFPRLAYNA
jgi:hypothetical protein